MYYVCFILYILGDCKTNSCLFSLITQLFIQPNGVMLTQSIIDPTKICRPLHVSVQNAIVNQSFADLKSQLPADMTLSDVKAVVDILKKQPAVHNAFGDGFVISNENMVCFFSGAMIKTCKEMLVSLVEEFSKVIAQQKLDQDKQPLDLAPENEMLPLQDVVNCVGGEYPELLDLQHQYVRHDIDRDGKTLLWNTDSNDDGPLVEFCRLGLYSDNFQRMCIRSVTAEVDRLNNIRHGVSVSTRVEGASTIQNIGESFESSFRLLCQMLQMFRRSLDTLSSRNQHIDATDGISVNALINDMKNELLMGCGVCLARLITEYCFFEHEIEDHDFYFDRLQGKGDNDGSDSRYLQNINMATLEFPFFSLKCRPDQNGKPRSPFNYLRSIFHGSVGSNLSQMWKLCTYDDDESNKDDRQHADKKLEVFINHLESICLPLVGIPFTVLDKKSEKRMLAERRESILHHIEQSFVNEEVVMCSTVLICQNIRSISISGRQTINSVLELLFEHDKKIPREVTKALKDLLANASIDSSGLLMQAKAFAGAKNSKSLSAMVHHE